MKANKITLVACKFLCKNCGALIESNSILVKCDCGAIGVDANPKESIYYRIIGERKNLSSRCVWKNEQGLLFCDYQ